MVFGNSYPCKQLSHKHGDIAQLIERSIRIAEVEGLSPSISTKNSMKTAA